MAGRPRNENLEIARLAGDRTYEGSVHDICGTTIRYTSGGGCVHCARLKQTDMRAALEAQRQGEDRTERFLDAALTEVQTGPKDPWD